MDVLIEWAISHAIAPLLGALFVGLAPPIRRAIGQAARGTWRILKAPRRLDRLEAWKERHEEIHPTPQEATVRD